MWLLLSLFVPPNPIETIERVISLKSMDVLTMKELMWAYGITLSGLEILNWIIIHAGRWMGASDIPVRGKHLDKFTLMDIIFTWHSRLMTPPLVYFILRYLYWEVNGLWAWNDLSLTNTILPIPALFLIYDFFYTILHWFLHIKLVYGYIHKHHHRQKAPSRGNIDAMNVHPIEYILGEYNHLWSLYIYCHYFQMPCHILCILIFLILSAIMAGFNHTRYDVVIMGYSSWSIFDSKNHDLHHRIPQCNYGQYTMFWDLIFGTFRPYDPKDRVNPMSQLDKQSGKSLQFHMPNGTNKPHM